MCFPDIVKRFYMLSADLQEQYLTAGMEHAPEYNIIDFEGDMRVADGNGDGIAVVDIGADEFLTLKPSATTLSASAGKPISFTLDAGLENNIRSFVVLGSMSGTSPGFHLPGGLVFPLNWDPVTDVILSNLNSGLFVNFLGQKVVIKYGGM